MMLKLIHTILFLTTSVLSKNVLEGENQIKDNLFKDIHIDSGFWRNAAERDLRKMTGVTRVENRAKNIIIFIGDGMGLQTHAMARIFKV